MKKRRLLAGGNPQIAKGDGSAPVVKWNSPFYGIEGKGWFASFHCFTKYVKVTFFNGASLRPVPPGASNCPAGARPDGAYLDMKTRWSS